MSLFLPIISKLGSESLLSLYPVFVKNINLPISIQVLSRVVIYTLIAGFLCNFTFIREHLFTVMGLLLGITNFIHIYTSYRGFQLLESGIAYTLFYTYPIMILLISQQKINMYVFIAFLGVYLLTMEQQKHENYENENENENEKKQLKENFPYEGFAMIFLAALTEALIYFQVRKISTKNNWNHLFIAYFLSSIVMIAYTMYSKEFQFQDKQFKQRFSLAIFLNGFIGTIGYFLRFYATSRIGPVFYSILSYFGIFMSFIYGVIFNQEQITWRKGLGALLIIISNYFIIKKI
jgi:drug/metabolite transporter (DMT)-like permease